MKRNNLLLAFLMVVISNQLSSSVPGEKDPKDWTILETHTISGKASGLAWDGTYIYYGIYGANGDEIYRFDPSTGQSNLQFLNATINDTYGMTFDGTDLWITDHGLSSGDPAYALQLDLTGSILSQFDLPDHYMSGIAWDNGDFWVATYYPDPGTIYKVDGSGNIIAQINTPADQPWDLCMEGNNLWVADYYANMLFKIDQTGAILESHACEDDRPAGIVFDGQYLWYIDGPLSSPSTLYKVDLGGAGTPAINVPVTNYDFGVVAVGDSAVWNCTINNSGTAPLEVNNVAFPGAVPLFTYQAFPFTIDPGNSNSIEFIFKPTESGTLNTIATIESNDPVNPEVELTIGGEAVFAGPHINIPVLFHDYGSVRASATTRWIMEITNDGNEDLEVSDITFEDEHFYYDYNLQLPLTISVLETIGVGIWFNPEEATDYESIAQIYHNDASQDPIELTFEGSGNEQDYPIGETFWNYTINTSFDNSIKGIAPINDVTGDGIGDVIICSEDDYVRCFNGNSDGIADLIWENEAGSVQGQNDVTIIEDINNDGFSDVIVGLTGAVKAVKALSGSTGSLLWIFDTHIYGDGGWVYQVWTKYDYDGDGISDVLACAGNDGNNTGPKRFFCLNGTDGSLIWDNYIDGPGFSIIGVQDFNGDDLPDVIGGGSNNGETEGKVFGIDGSSGNTQWTFTTAGTSVWALEQLDDATGDGISDIIAGDFAGNYYLIDPGSGSAFQSGSAGNNIILRFERMDDVNGNGYADISLGYSGTNALMIDGLDGSNIWLTSLADKVWNIDKIADITGDGISDMVTGTLFGSNYVYFIDGANGNELFSEDYGEPLDAIAAIPDINGDGSWEMVAGGRQGNIKCYSGGLNASLLAADFVANPLQGYIPLEVEFTDLSLGDITEWHWDFNNDGTFDSDEQNPIYTYVDQGEYSVKLVISNGLSSDTLLKPGYIIADTTVGINSVMLNTKIDAYPNPFSDHVLIQTGGKTAEQNTIKIYNATGILIREIQQRCINCETSIFEWDGKNAAGKTVSKGVYYGKVISGDTLYSIKLVHE
ncbi:MAG: choice-of-anchor D domain-containing protein [Bacteroidales bacterium]|nr:choice-of-anchor D domain-containing protein [Bacteroidales bacterium]